MILHADARALPLADRTVDCCVTSPPYWGLRDYGHAGQLGLEPTPDAYVAALVGVFREVWRVLKPAATLWLNLGDSYAGGGTIGRNDTTPLALARRAARYGTGTGSGSLVGFQGNRPSVDDLKPKNLVGIPWRVAFALQADGWYLRSDIIWHKPNPMPESVTDRPTKAHEYLFLLTKAERYYYDADAIKEPLTTDAKENYPGRAHIIGRGGLASLEQGTSPQQRSNGGFPPRKNDTHETSTRNKRSVWTIPTMPYVGAHFATMPEALVEPCILAGCPLGGLVLDPFLGSGTVGAVAERLGRRWLGCDLAYHGLAQARTAQRGFRFTELVPA